MKPPHAPAVTRFAANTHGRDWIVGDIHGAYDLVIDAMRLAKFDRTRDRLFVPGDLVDRGAGSQRARRFLEQDYVFATRGNHEKFWLDLYEQGPPDPSVVKILSERFNLGLQWWLDAAPEDRDALVAQFRLLPTVIEIETPRGLVGLVHGDVPAGMDWSTFTHLVAAGDQRVMKVALEGRDRIRGNDDSGVAGVGRIFVGHTPQWGGMKKFGNVYAIDTGAVFSTLEGERNVSDGQLTMVEACARTGALIAATDANRVDVRADPSRVDYPFGQYLRERR